MFNTVAHNTPQPKWKHPLYLALAMVLWGILGFLINVLLAAVAPTYPIFDWEAVVLIADGCLAGYFIGKIWWRWVYVEGWRFKHPRH